NILSHSTQHLEDYLDACTTPQSQQHTNPPTQVAETFTHADQSHSRTAPPVQYAIDVEADAVVLNGAVQSIRHSPYLYACARGPSVARDVVQRFLHRAIDRRLDRRRELAQRTRVDGDDESASLLHAAREKFQCSNEADLLEESRPDFVRDPAQLLFDRVEVLTHLVETRTRG